MISIQAAVQIPAASYSVSEKRKMVLIQSICANSGAYVNAGCTRINVPFESAGKDEIAVCLLCEPSYRIMPLFASVGAVLRADSCSDSCKYPNPAFANLWLFFMATTLVPILSLRACIRTLKLVKLPLAQYPV